MSIFVNQLKEYVHQQLSDFPFHNLEQLSGIKPVIGGTCFDHALKLRELLVAAGYSAHLHEAQVCMTGESTHRLVRVAHNDKDYILDTGSGWPTKYVLCPDQMPMKINVAGVCFKVMPKSNYFLISRRNENQWREMNKIPREKLNESKILDKFERRYNCPLPFNNSLRLCWLSGKKFYRIVGNTLYLYEAGKNVNVKKMTLFNMLKFIDSVFPELVTDLDCFFSDYVLMC